MHDIARQKVINSLAYIEPVKVLCEDPNCNHRFCEYDTYEKIYYTTKPQSLDDLADVDMIAIALADQVKAIHSIRKMITFFTVFAAIGIGLYLISFLLNLR